MLFPTTDFAIFFAIVFLGHWLLNHSPTRWKLFMIAASYYFYAWWDWRFIFLLGGSTVIAHFAAKLIHRSEELKVRRAWLVAAVAANLALLGWFKYYGFFAVSVDNTLRTMGLGVPMPLLAVTLPVGISFFTFSALSYIIDVYRRDLIPAPGIDVAVYLSFFPHLIAGPIMRGSELLPQIQTRRDPRRIDIGRASWLIFAGLFKKVVISSFVATAIVDPVFGSPGQHSSLEILFAIYGYAVQIYCDFSGYTDMAIGLALLLGVQFPQNFDSPYTALTLQDFWRRWHMTLSRWLRDYLYIPLGGNRGGRLQTYRNIMITMVLGGLWHGAAWTFIAWGALQGIGQVTGHWRRSRRVALGLPAMAEGVGARIRQRVITFNLVCLGWVFFRAQSFGIAEQMITRLFTAWGPAPLVTPLVVLAIGFGIFMQYIPREVPELVQARFSRLAPVAQGAVLGGSLYLITAMGPQGVAPFIYFRF